MTQELIPKTTDWYNALMEEARAAWVEMGFTLRWTLIERNHKLGELLRQNAEQENVNITELVKQVSLDLDCSHSLLWQCVQFYDKFPALEKLEKGKAISWTEIRGQLSGEKEACTHEVLKSVKVCAKCGKKV